MGSVGPRARLDARKGLRYITKNSAWWGHHTEDWRLVNRDSKGETMKHSVWFGSLP